ncbi:hypothetical protein [Halorubrum sp. Atlit-28R]|uniref:hypothetical protein n=1 Tax=Halorubrum sp. Atlit-28R TaxID=2282129 RepID=UPI001F28EAE3|nr:hypothetical protein [Halorubrum sp. Atlit-28R]
MTKRAGRSRGPEPYPTNDPARDLEWYVQIEAMIQSASALSARALSDDDAERGGDGEAPSEWVDRLVVEPDDTGVESGHALTAKRRAQATDQSVVGNDLSPLW